MAVSVFFAAKAPAEAAKARAPLARAAALGLGARNAARVVNLILTDGPGIKKLNRSFLGKNRLTDVIAFNLNPAVQESSHLKGQRTETSCGIPREAGGGPSAMRARPDEVYASRRAPAMRAENFNRSFQANFPPMPGAAWGEIYVCLPVAAKQARAMGHSLLTELLVLTTHGALHLAGMDDKTPALRRRMNERTAALLKKL